MIPWGAHEFGLQDATKIIKFVLKLLFFALAIVIFALVAYYISRTDRRSNTVGFALANQQYIEQFFYVWTPIKRIFIGFLSLIYTSSYFYSSLIRSVLDFVIRYVKELVFIYILSKIMVYKGYLKQRCQT